LEGEQLLAAQRGQDLDRSSRAVERVEVEPGHTRRQQLDALRDAVLHTEGTHSLLVRRLFNLNLKSCRYGCP